MPCFNSMKIKIKKKYVYFSFFLLVFIVFSLILYKNSIPGQINVDSKGFLSLQNPTLKYETSLYEKNENFSIFLLKYESSGQNVYGFIVEPRVNSRSPAALLLPGAGVDKLSELTLAKIIASHGYTVLTIDQRGVGQTDGHFPSFEEDYQSYLSNKIPIQHLMIQDAIIAADILKKLDKVDSNKVFVIGESLGGRIAIIAASIDKSLKGVIVISTAGFHYTGSSDSKQDIFINSIDPDNYIAKISPRPVFMLHNLYDKNVVLDSANITFAKAKEPKSLLIVNDSGCNHGYCDSMLNLLNSSINSILRS